MRIIHLRSCMSKKREPEKFSIDLPHGRNRNLLLHFLTPVEIVIDGKEYVLHENACIFYRDGMRTKYTSKRNEMFNSFALFDIIDEEEFLRYRLPEGVPFYVDDIGGEQISLLWDEMTFLLVTHFGEMISFNLQRIFLDICTIMSRCAQDKKIQEPNYSESYLRLLEVRKKMYRQCGKISVADAAKELFFDRTYFSMIYKSTFGISPRQDIQNAKIERACNLLLYSNLKLDRIAIECNFSDTSNFIRFFICHKHMTPNQFRKRYAATSPLR